MTDYYVPGTEETDPKKTIMSLQQAHEKTATNTTDIATNTAAIAANTAAIAAIAAPPSAATQANQEAASSTTVFVPPGRQQFHPSAAKAWVSFTGSTGVILASYNVTSVTRSSTGIYIVNFTTAFSSTNYAANISASTGGFIIQGNSAQAAGTFGIQCLNASFAVSDPTAVYAVFYGDQ